MNTPFDLEAFKAGQKAIHVNSFSKNTVSFLTVSSKGLIVFEYDDDGVVSNSTLKTMEDYYVMASRHQALIDAYDPEDTWQFNVKTYDEWFDIKGKPEWEEGREFRLHPHNDLIKAWKKGAKIEAYIVGDWVEEPNPDWYEDTKYRIKQEPIIHCLAYDASLDPNPKLWGAPVVSEKQLAIKKGWKIIQEWEV